MKIHKFIVRFLKTSSHHTGTSFILVVLLLISSCTKKMEPYSILEFTGSSSVLNYSKQLQQIGFPGDSTHPAALLASEGDLIILDEGLYYYRRPSQNKFCLKDINWVTYINDKVVSVNIPDNEDVIPWFKQMNSADLSDLQYLKIPMKLPESYIPLFNELVKIKPDISVDYSGENLDDLVKKIRNFNPRFLSGLTLYEKDYKLLPGFTNLELLLAILGDSIYKIPLPAMPQLKILIMNPARNYEMSNDLLKNNKQIEKLIIMKEGIFDFSLIEPLENLKELTVNGYDTIINLDLIKKHRNLELLSLGIAFKPNRILDELPALRWMSFSSKTSQDDFDSFIEHHPNIEIVEIIDNKDITNLKPLLGLVNIYGLTVSGTVEDTVTIKKLKKLKYLSLPADFLQDSLLSAELKKLYPSTVIAPNEGVCLGSGWLLLIIPLVLSIMIVKRKKAIEARGSK
jgi:hypothetical protein